MKPTRFETIVMLLPVVLVIVLLIVFFLMLGGCQRNEPPIVTEHQVRDPIADSVLIDWLGRLDTSDVWLAEALVQDVNVEFHDSTEIIVVSYCPRNGKAVVVRFPSQKEKP